MAGETSSLFELASIFLVLTALLAYANQRFVGLPISIGVMVIALVLSFALLALDKAGLFEGVHDYIEQQLHALDFSALVFQGMLSLLLFAGALQIDLSELREHRWPIAALAVAGTIVSTIIVGFVLWWIAPSIGLELSLVHCLLFGALISPTDPIAVMGIMRSAGAPKNLELVITGESLFNDGIAVVMFALMLGMLAGGQAPTFEEGAIRFVREAGGGVVLGFVLGYVTFRLLRSIDQYQVEVLITLATVMGGTMLAIRLHVSAPIAMVVAGLVIGNHGRELAMSDTTRHYVDLFWDLLDDMLNAVLFALLGLEIIVIKFAPGVVAAGLGAVVVTLAARALSVGLPAALWRARLGLPHGSWKVLTWGALRGGISVALALSLPYGPARETLIAMTYCVVVFSILVQGLSIGWVVRHGVRDTTQKDA
jgi:CPA1 family monovalent cation:H+ antiporter